VKSKFAGIATIVLLLAGCSSNSDGIEPQPTKTVYVPVPGSGIDPGFQDDLDDIRETNCRLANDLMFQSLDLSRQARDLESQSYSMPSGSDLSYQLQDQARNLRQQSLNLAFQSDQLRQNC
jgi:hypothetical protein